VGAVPSARSFEINGREVNSLLLQRFGLGGLPGKDVWLCGKNEGMQ